MVKIDVDQDMFVVWETVLEHIEYISENTRTTHFVSPEHEIETVSGEETEGETEQLNTQHRPGQARHPSLTPLTSLRELL